MRLKWFLVTFLCVAILHSACVVRAEHEDYPEEDEDTNKDVGGSEDLMELAENAEEIVPAEDPPPPEEEPSVPEAVESETEDVQVEAVEPNQDVTDVDVGVQPKIGARKSGNYYFDEDYYSSNYDVDINYDWSK